MSEHDSVNRQPRTTADERERAVEAMRLVFDTTPTIPLPSHPRTVRVEPHTGIAAWSLEPGDELVIQNNSGVKIEVEAGTLSHGRVERINELVKERDELKQSLIVVCDKLLRATSECDELRKAAGLDDESEAGE